MRLIPLTLAAAALATPAIAPAANSSPPPIASVQITVGPALQKKAAKYGERELTYLTRDLQRAVDRAVDRAGARSPAGARLELILADATPNRPTFKELTDRPGLSLESFGVGGAEIRGALVSADGARTPVSFKWYESDIRWARASTTWSDAERTFSWFADDLAHGRLKG